MLFRTKHFELEIANFLYLRAPWVGVIYVGPDSGHGCIVRYSPQQLEFDHVEYIEMTRRNLRERQLFKGERSFVVVHRNSHPFCTWTVVFSEIHLRELLGNLFLSARW